MEGKATNLKQQQTGSFTYNQVGGKLEHITDEHHKYDRMF